MKPENVAKLQTIWDLVAAKRRAGEDAKSIISHLVDHHGATYRDRYDGYALRAGGVASSCTYSAEGLIGNWIKTASLRLMSEAMK